ncbi:MAG: hypothetical protein M0P97_02415 [Candidatus Moranbacteria bacterium]|jgi:hypothetical protein|nr:hypothetical protein [Candidatus Moranbacteria bacterium]
MDLLKHAKQIEKQTLLKNDSYLGDVRKQALIQWEGPEYENYPKDRRWYLLASLFLGIVIVYALITNSPLMAITFILIGIVGFIHLEKDPSVYTYSITKEGVHAERELYEFDDIQSFWILYKEPHQRILSLHTNGWLIPYVHIPIHEVDSEDVRQTMLQFISEKKQHPSIVDTLERLLHI